MDSYSYTGVLNSEKKKPKSFLIVNKSPKGDFICTKLAIILMAVITLILLLLAIIATYFLTSNFAEGQNCVNVPQMSKIFKNEMDYYDRLPRNVIPSHYRLKLMPFIEENNFTTDGYVSINVTCLETSDNITLNINDIHIDEQSVSVWQYNEPETEKIEISIKNHIYDPSSQTYIIVLKNDLLAGKLYSINIHFQSELNDLLQGFYRSHYVDSRTGEVRWMASTQFSPIDARRAYPCFDEPDRKSRFTISIARDSRRHRSMSNMQIYRTQPVDDMDGWVWDHYNTTPLMSTYLTAFIVSDLKQLDSVLRPNNVKFTVWTRSDALEQARYANSIGPRVLEYLERYFDIPFPLPKQDMVAVPDFGFNAMENWGLITYRESAMLYDDKRSTAKAKQRVATVISHELGHQWFGNLVTPKWWDDLWLKEGFATYLQYLGAHHVEPTWKLLDQFVLDELHTAFGMDALESTHPISFPVHHTSEIRQMFNSISYKKGASLIRMMNHFLGEDTFKAGLQDYLIKHKFANAEQDELWESLNEQAVKDEKLPANMTIKEIMDTWTLQSGYPVVTVTRNYETDSAELTQDKFTIGGVRDDMKIWTIPITYTTKRERNFNDTLPKLWLNDSPKQIIVHRKIDWVIVNLHNVGYYRVNYDPTNWDLLTKDYIILPELVRAQLIDDALNIARSGILEYEIALNLLKELTKEIKYMPWNAAERAMSYLDHMLSQSPIYGEFKVFALSILNNANDNLGFDERPTDDHLTLLNRPQVLKMVCGYGDPHCIMISRHKFREWMIDEDNNFRISSNIKPVVYCTAIAAGTKDEWDFLFRQYLKSNVGSDKEIALDALGCASEPWLLSRYLNLSISSTSGIRKQDGARVFTSVANNVIGHNIAFNFLRNNWDEINKYYGEAFSSVSNMVEALHVYMNTPAELEELKEFRKQHEGNLGTTESAFQTTIMKVTGNVDWMKNSYKSVEEWLRTMNRRFGLV